MHTSSNVFRAAKTVFQWREFIFGGFRARIVVAPPAEADRAWVPTKIYPPAQQSIRDEANPNVIRLFDPTTGGALGKGVAKVFNADDVQVSPGSNHPALR